MSWLPLFVRRATQLNQMAFDAALAQMYALCVQPSLVSRLSVARKLTKNRYERDDPAFVVLQLAFLAVSVVAQGEYMRASAPRLLVVLLYRLLVDYVLCGVCIATLTWLLVRRVCAPTRGGAAMAATTTMLHDAWSLSSHGEGDGVTWAYAFDVHCNAYFVHFVWTQLLGFTLLPLVVRTDDARRNTRWWSSSAVVLGNTLALCGAVSYVYVVFVGYLHVPTLQHQQRLLYPMPLLVLAWLLMCAAPCNALAAPLQATWHT